MPISYSTRKWRVKIANEISECRLVDELRISRLLARLLINRNITEPEAGHNFLRSNLSDMHSPFLLKDMDKATDRIVRAIYQKEKILIYGDYDADGITATALLVNFLTDVGANVSYYIPRRETHGYGLNSDGIDMAKAQGISLIITVDCGVTDFEQIDYCNSLGIDIVVTDHHKLADRIPDALAVINPLRSECGYPFKFLAGVGVAFNLVISLRSQLRDNGFWNSDRIPNLREYMDLVAIGTVADIVPLVDQNRIYVKYGIIELARSSRPGIIALKEVSGSSSDSIDASTIGFRLAPRLNATGRIGTAEKAVKLLTTKSLEEAYTLARILDEKNRRRQQMEEVILKDAEKMIASSDVLKNSKSLVLASPDWHQGVVGIVASRLVDKYSRPAVIICIEGDMGRGSARSIQSFDLFTGLQNTSEYLADFGGHKYAAGLNIRVQDIDSFRQAFEDYVCKNLAPEDFVPCIDVDGYLNLEEISVETMADLEMLKPHGFGNPEPLFIEKNLDVATAQIVGDGHLKMKLNKKNSIWNAIGFGLGKLTYGDLKNIDIVFAPGINEWQGRRLIQIKIKDFRDGVR